MDAKTGNELKQLPECTLVQATKKPEEKDETTYLFSSGFCNLQGF